MTGTEKQVWPKHATPRELPYSNVAQAMGDAGSEWGMGGHDETSYFKTAWTP